MDPFEAHRIFFSFLFLYRHSTRSGGYGQGLIVYFLSRLSGLCLISYISLALSFLKHCYRYFTHGFWLSTSWDSLSNIANAIHLDTAGTYSSPLHFVRAGFSLSFHWALAENSFSILIYVFETRACVCKTNSFYTCSAVNIFFFFSIFLLQYVSRFVVVYFFGFFLLDKMLASIAVRGLHSLWQLPSGKSFAGPAAERHHRDGCMTEPHKVWRIIDVLPSPTIFVPVVCLIVDIDPAVKYLCRFDDD